MKIKEETSITEMIFCHSFSVNIFYELRTGRKGFRDERDEKLMESREAMLTMMGWSNGGEKSFSGIIFGILIKPGVELRVK